MHLFLFLYLLIPLGHFSSSAQSGWSDSTLQEYFEEEELCRHKNYLPKTLFEWDTCAWCYKYMPNSSVVFGTPSLKLNVGLARWSGEEKSHFILTLISNDTRILANASDPSSPVWQSFASEGAKRDWADCCSSAKSCCEGQMNLLEESGGEKNSTGLECPPTWDGWQCWDRTFAGVTATVSCPPYIYFLTEAPSCSIPLEKKCTVEGLWFRHPKSKEEWTNYSGCGSATVSMQLRRAYVLISANAISIVALLPALFVFFAYKQLRVHRIILHQNLFLSMLMNGVLVILFKSMVMLNELQHNEHSPIEENSIGCRFLLILTKYSRMTNYMWMFCEGFYLHKLIAAAFAEQKSLLVFYLIGWVFPILPTCIYGVYRLNWANSMCWVVPEEAWEWVLNGPSLLSLIINSLFLVNIIRVLVTKLRSTHSQEPSQYRKAVRATLVLLPLFGVHFLVTIYRPPTSTGVCLWTEIYFYTNDILDGIQGFMVALIFCYFNGEVSTLLGRTYKRLKDRYLGNFGNSGGRGGGGARRQGSLGKSVVTTQVYSSVVPSPEINCMAVLVESGGEQGDSNLLGVNGNKSVNLVVSTTQGSVESSSV